MAGFLTDLLRFWPFVLGGAAFAGWIGLSLWRISNWTTQHDSTILQHRREIDEHQTHLSRHDGDFTVILREHGELAVIVSRHDGILQGRK